MSGYSPFIYKTLKMHVFLIINMTLGDGETKKIKKLHEMGFTIREIAKKTGRDKNTINKYIKSSGEQSLIDKLTGIKKTPRNKSINSMQIANELYNSNQTSFHNNYEDPRFFEFIQPNNESINQQVMQDTQFEEERFERERNWKHAQQIDAEIKSLKQKFEGNKSREREEAQMNQLQHEIEMLKIDNKYLKNPLESKPLAQIDNSALKVMNEKENEKKYTVLKPIPIQEEIKNQENAEIDTIAKESDVFQNNKGQDTKDATVDLEVVPESSNIENDFESNEDTIEVEIPIWVPIVIGSVCKIIKKGMNFLDTPECKLPTSSPEYWKKLAECLRNNN